MKTIRLIIILGAFAVAGFAQTLTVLPAVQITGTPGSTIGWGYSITDNSTTDDLEPFSLSLPAFPGNLDPNAIFDYPVIAPGQTVTETFSTTALNGPCTALPCGLYDVFIPLGTAPETVSGIFTIQSEYINAATGADDGAAPNMTGPYSLAVIAGTTTPEPGTLLLLAAGVTAVFARRLTGNLAGR
jgi:hypothetical protein